jgi:hypothetical protein
MEAWSFIQDKEKLYREAMLWRAQQVRTDFLQLRARSALMAARQASQPGRLLRVAERDARALKRESADWSRALGCLMAACRSTEQPGGNKAELFRTAANRLEAADLGVFAAAARYRQGQQMDGDDGRLLRESALAWLTMQGVRNPLNIIRSHAPTFF